MDDNITKRTTRRLIFSKLTSGSNSFPDWLENSPVGTSSLGTPYYDSVRFILDDDLFSEEYVNSLISVTTSAEISRTYVNGRKGSIKQITNEGDYEITFKIKIFSEFGYTTSDVTRRRVGRGLPVPQIGTFSDRVGFRPDFASFVTERKQYEMASTPNSNVRELVDLINEFYNNSEYVNMQVESLYLNDVFGIYNIIPYSIITQQNYDEINSYEIVIQAYSDFQDIENVEQEIIPK